MRYRQQLTKGDMTMFVLPCFRYLDANGIDSMESAASDVVSEIGRLTKLTKL